jgi:hypothetical protein
MKKQKPFFAKFLENQFTAEEAMQVKGGDDFTTMKYPSDQEDNGGNPGYGPCNNPGASHNPNCMATTMKYPSDQED